MQTSRAEKTITVLLVEDDNDDYLFTREYLEGVPGQSYDITWVQNYVAGLQTISSQPFDVTLIDYRIDTGTGLEFIRMMRARNIDCPAILLTGVRSREVDIAAQQAGASDYLVKGSLNAEILERSIRYAIAHANRRRVLDSVLANIGAAVIALDANDSVMMMNDAARKLVGLDGVGQYAPDNSIGIFSNVRRFIGEAPYPSSVFDSSGREYILRYAPLAGKGKLVILHEAIPGRLASENRNARELPLLREHAQSIGLTPAATNAIYGWMEKVLSASKQLIRPQGASSWQQFATELRHSGRKLIHSVDELQMLGATRDSVQTGSVVAGPSQATAPTRQSKLVDA